MGAYTSLNTLCTYLESDVSAEGQAERNFWVSFLVPARFCMTDGGLNGMLTLSSLDCIPDLWKVLQRVREALLVELQASVLSVSGVSCIRSVAAGEEQSSSTQPEAPRANHLEGVSYLHKDLEQLCAAAH